MKPSGDQITKIHCQLNESAAGGGGPVAQYPLQVFLNEEDAACSMHSIDTNEPKTELELIQVNKSNRGLLDELLERDPLALTCDAKNKIPANGQSSSSGYFNGNIAINVNGSISPTWTNGRHDEASTSAAASIDNLNPFRSDLFQRTSGYGNMYSVFAPSFGFQNPLVNGSSNINTNNDGLNRHYSYDPNISWNSYRNCEQNKNRSDNIGMDYSFHGPIQSIYNPRTNVAFPSSTYIPSTTNSNDKNSMVNKLLIVNDEHDIEYRVITKTGFPMPVMIDKHDLVKRENDRISGDISFTNSVGVIINYTRILYNRR